MENQPPLSSNETEIFKNKQNEISEKTLSEYMKEKFGEHAPKISLHFYSGPHYSATDAEGVKERLDDADIYIPEYSGWSQTFLDKLRDISAGKIPAEGAVKHPYLVPILESLHDTDKPVTLIDTPFRVTREQRKEMLHLSINPDMTFQEAIDDIDKVTESRSVAVFKEREKYMISQLGPRIAEIIEERPELLQKEKINVLLTLGVAHTNIMKELKRDPNTEVTKELRYSPEVFGFYSELERRHVFGKEVSEELKAKALAEILVVYTSFGEYLHKTKDTSIFLRCKRFLADCFTEEEIKQLFEEWKNTTKQKEDDLKDFLHTPEGIILTAKLEGDKTQADFNNAFETWKTQTGRNNSSLDQLFTTLITQKGLRIPQSDEEAMEIMKIKKNA